MKEQTANKTQYTFEEVIAIPYVQESIDSLIHISLKEYPMLINHKDDIRQLLLIVINRAIPTFGGKVDIKTYIRRCLDKAIVGIRLRFLTKSAIRIYKAVPFETVFFDETNPDTTEFLVCNDSEIIEKHLDVYSIINSCPPEVQEVAFLLLDGYTIRDIASKLNIPKSTLFSNQVKKLKEAFQKFYAK